MVVTPNRNQVLFRLGDDLEMVSTLIAGQFPNYEAILPKGHSTRVTHSHRGFPADCQAGVHLRPR